LEERTKNKAGEEVMKVSRAISWDERKFPKRKCWKINFSLGNFPQKNERCPKNKPYFIKEVLKDVKKNVGNVADSDVGADVGYVPDGRGNRQGAA